MMLGILGICAGFCDRILIGVTGGVAFIVGLASLLAAPRNLNPWVLLTAIPVAAVVALLLKIASQARLNKTCGARRPACRVDGHVDGF